MVSCIHSCLRRSGVPDIELTQAVRADDDVGEIVLFTRHIGSVRVSDIQNLSPFSWSVEAGGLLGCCPRGRAGVCFPAHGVGHLVGADFPGIVVANKGCLLCVLELVWICLAVVDPDSRSLF